MAGRDFLQRARDCDFVCGDRAHSEALVVTTPLDFAYMLTNFLSLDPTPNRLHALVAWEAFEGGHWANQARYNPLNTTRSVEGSHPWSGKIPIQVFPDWQSGVKATALTIAQGNMIGIARALVRDDSPTQILYAVKNSPWGTTAIVPENWQALYDSYAQKQDGAIARPVNFWAVVAVIAAAFAAAIAFSQKMKW